VDGSRSLPAESREQTQEAGLYARAAANYGCAIQNLNNLPADDETVRAELPGLKRRALTVRAMRLYWAAII